jgi:tetratricopeptide (TPR) repeat protein
MRNERGNGIGNLINLLAVVLVLFVGYQLWLTHKRDEPPAPPASSAALTAPGDTPAPSMTTQTAVTLPDPSAQTADIPASPHAATLRAIHQMIQQGNDAEAEAKLMAFPQEALDDQQVREYAATLWNNLGAARVKARGVASWVSAYRTAIVLNPENATARLNLARAYWKLKDSALTREFLETTIRLAPDTLFPHLALAELLYDKDDLAGAAIHLDHATQRALQNPEFQSYLEFVTAKVKRAEKAEQKFISRESSHFMVKYDGAEDSVVWNRVLEVLEEAYREIGQKFQYFPSQPIMVVLHTQETFHSATGSPAWADGLFDPILGRIKVPTRGALTDQAWLTRVLRHEYVHALLHKRMEGRLGAVPTWLNEGLAMQLAGDAWPDIDQVVRGQVTLINLTDLEGGWGHLPANAAIVAYLEGNSATRYFIDRFGMEKVREVLGLLATGQPFAQAFQDRLFISYDEFQRRWTDHLNEKLKAGKT